MPPFLPGFAWAALALLIAFWGFVRMIGMPWLGRIQHFGDGDTVESRAWFNDYRIRIRGMDAPEYTQDYGKEARKALVELLEGRRVLFLPFGSDKHGRLLCWMFCARGPVSWIMVWRGHAWPDSLPTFLIHLPARLFRRGLWKSSVRIRPSHWRRYGQRMSYYVPQSPPQPYAAKSRKSGQRQAGGARTARPR